MAGAFGYGTDTYDFSMKMGSAKLFPQVRDAEPETIVVADGTSCRAQIKDQSEIKAVHIANFLEPLIIEKIN